MAALLQYFLGYARPIGATNVVEQPATFPSRNARQHWTRNYIELSVHLFNQLSLGLEWSIDDAQVNPACDQASVYRRQPFHPPGSWYFPCSASGHSYICFSNSYLVFCFQRGGLAHLQCRLHMTKSLKTCTHAFKLSRCSGSTSS